tara:strand:- start:288 stop:458 length:171 start_codon:yes stop_codon:yes gene_type:complete
MRTEEQLRDARSDFDCDIWQVIYDERHKKLSIDDMRDILLNIEEKLLAQEEEGYDY